MVASKPIAQRFDDRARIGEGRVNARLADGRNATAAGAGQARVVLIGSAAGPIRAALGRGRPLPHHRAGGVTGMRRILHGPTGGHRRPHGRELHAPSRRRASKNEGAGVTGTRASASPSGANPAVPNQKVRARPTRSGVTPCSARSLSARMGPAHRPPPLADPAPPRGQGLGRGGHLGGGFIRQRGGAQIPGG